MHLLFPGVGGSGLQNINNNLALISLSFFAALSLIRALNDSGHFQLPPNFNLTSLAVALILISAATSKSSSLYAPLGVLFWFFIYLAALQKNTAPDKRQLLWIVLVSAVTEACLGALQVFGWTPQIDGSSLSTNGVPVGGIQQSNLFASYLCVGIAAWCWLIIDRSIPSMVNKWDCCVAAATCVLVAMIILSGSRTGWVAIVVVSTLGGSALLLAKKTSELKLWVASFVVGALVAILLSSLTGSERVSEKAHLESKRWQLYQQALTLAGEQPVSGVGYGNFEPSYVRSAAVAFASGKSEYPALTNFTHVHNGPLQWYIEGGILGLAGMGIMSIAILMLCWKRATPNVLAYLCFLTPLGLHFLTEFPFRQSMVHAWLLIVGAYCMTSKVRSVSLSPGLAGPARAVVVSILWLAIPVFALNNLNTIYWTREINKAPFENAALATKILLPGPLRAQTEYTLALGLFVAGYRGNSDALQTFSRWAEEEIQQLPRKGLIEMLIRAKVIAEDEEGANSARELLEFYFPDLAEGPSNTSTSPN